MSLGDNIKKIRRQKKLTQQELADKIGISRSYLSDVENNRYNPSSKTIELFSDKLNVSMFYLITGNKSLSDLPPDSFYRLESNFEKDVELLKLMEEGVKEDLKLLQGSILSEIETKYLRLMLDLLNSGDAMLIKEISSIVYTVISSQDYKPSNMNKDELNKSFKRSIDNGIKFLNEFYLNNKYKNE